MMKRHSNVRSSNIYGYLYIHMKNGVRLTTLEDRHTFRFSYATPLLRWKSVAGKKIDEALNFLLYNLIQLHRCNHATVIKSGWWFIFRTTKLYALDIIFLAIDM